MKDKEKSVAFKAGKFVIKKTGFELFIFLYINSCGENISKLPIY